MKGCKKQFPWNPSETWVLTFLASAVHAGVYVCANCSVTPPTWFFGHDSMMSPDSTWNYKNITLYLTQNQQVCKELWDFQAACTGWRYTVSFLGLNFVCTDPNFDM
jgi:predicted amidohydrolase